MGWGVCPESMWPYDENHSGQRPSANCYLEASLVEIHACRVGLGIDDFKTCLSKGLPFVFGFNVYYSFFNIDSSGMMPMPSSAEKVAGYHGVCAMGYDDSQEVLIVRNSWGKDWGDS